MKLIYDPITKKYTPESIKQEEEKREPVIPIQDQMNIRKLFGGLPIYNTSSGVNPKDGEIYLVSAGSSKRFCIRFSGITVSSSY